jgi:hypothetical protein
MVPSQFQPSLPLTLRIAAGYMVAIGAIGIVLPLLHMGPNYREFRAKSPAYRIGAQTSELIISAAYLVAGIGLFWQEAWARKLSLGFLLIGTIYGANAFAWGFSRRLPTRRVRIFSLIVVAVWNALWFCLIYRLAL